MKKFISLIIVLALLATGLPPVVTRAAEPSEPEKACAEKLQEFEKIKEKPFPTKREELTNSYFQDRFEEAQEAYHSYVECIIQFAQDRLWGVMDSSSSSTAPTLSDVGSPDWNKPEEACLSQEKITKIYGVEINANALIPPLLEAYDNYKTFLESIVNKYKTGPLKTEKVSLAAIAQHNALATALEHKITMEVETSLVAMNTALTTLQELRTAFVMHIHFQCMIANLTKYRKVLEAIRTAILDLPARLEDASIHK